MNARKIILLLLLLPLIFYACKENEIMTMEPGSSLNFPKRNYLGSKFAYDSLSFNSIFYNGPEIADYKIPVYLTGLLSSQDRQYLMKINTEESRGLIRNTHYTFEEQQTFKGGAVLDSALLKINITAIKAEKVEGRIILELVPNENFDRGLDSYQSIIISISGKGLGAQPAFWNSNSLSDYGGTYSHVKAEKFIELNGIPSASWKAANKAIVYAYAKKTYEWFNDNPTYEGSERVYFKGTIQF